MTTKKKPQPRKNGKRFNLRGELIRTVLAMDDVYQERIALQTNDYDFKNKLAVEYRKFCSLIDEI